MGDCFGDQHLWGLKAVGLRDREELHCHVGCSKVLCRDLGAGKVLQTCPTYYRETRLL